MNSGRGASQGIKIGVKISNIVHNANYINNIKNIFNAFINGCKSSILLTGIGMLVGGSLNFGLIIYIGNYLSKLFEDELKKDNGENFLLNASKDFNKAIESFSRVKSRPRALSLNNKNIKKHNKI